MQRFKYPIIFFLLLTSVILVGIYAPAIIGVAAVLGLLSMDSNKSESDHIPQPSEPISPELQTINHSLQPMFMSAQAKTNYLQSIEWQELRTQALARANNQCECCHSTERLEAHHTSYLHLGEADSNELNDLAILCRNCHQALHNKLGYDRTTNSPISILKDQ